ncbi:hypothetical protein C0991_001368 [Blastosporella zonata]|nr:hypothetical protein C0991_004393 [Blastosporella zonata]KAG6863984.1 hypothetical protein C0991_001368 [Blastosporella zonata]
MAPRSIITVPICALISGVGDNCLNKKMRKHIGKALKTRSQAIRTALERYNMAAALVTPAKPPLAWEQVVEYAFLSDFDLLRDCRQDIRERRWARPAARLAMDSYFKMERAQEEIERLNTTANQIVSYEKKVRRSEERECCNVIECPYEILKVVVRMCLQK